MTIFDNLRRIKELEKRLEQQDKIIDYLKEKFEEHFNDTEIECPVEHDEHGNGD